MRRLILTMMLPMLLVPLHAHAYDTLLGSRVWLPGNNALKHFATDSPSAREQYGITERSFTIKGEVLVGKALPSYRVVLENGKEAYLYKGDLERMVENFGVYLHPPGMIPEDYDREQAQMKTPAVIKTEVVKASLKTKGVAEGGTVYLRRPGYGLPGLSAAKIRSISVRKDGAITLNLDSKVGEIIEQFRSQQDLQAFFAIGLLSALPKWDKKIFAAVQERKLLPGMTKEQVAASWGAPDDFNRTITKTSADEQWFYGTTSQLYFENDLLKGWKD